MKAEARLASVSARLASEPTCGRAWLALFCRTNRQLAVAACLSAISLSAGLAHAERDREPPLLLGGSTPRAVEPVRWDPRLPHGARQATRARPGEIEPRGCAPWRPVCVHRGLGVSKSAAQLALNAAELAYERLVLALGLPEPLPSGGAAELAALDIYLTGPQTPASELGVFANGGQVAGFDASSGFCVLHVADASLSERSTSQCLAELVALRLDPAETPYLRRAFATALWWLVGLPTSLDVEAIDNVQSTPFRTLAAREVDESSEGAALWFDYFESVRSTRKLAWFNTAWWALAVNQTPASALRFENEPDLFDVLRHTLDGSRSELARVVASWAVNRAFIGSRDDGTHWPHLDFAGDFGRVRFDWVLPRSSFPRRVAAARALEPLGSAYLWVDLDNLTLGSTLAFQATWEAPVQLCWLIVRVDRDGRELSRIEVPFQEQATSTEQRLTNLEGAAGLLIVGTNLGGVDLAHPFDPDVAPFEPHGFVVYLAELPD